MKFIPILMVSAELAAPGLLKGTEFQEKRLRHQLVMDQANYILLVKYVSLCHTTEIFIQRIIFQRISFQNGKIIWRNLNFWNMYLLYDSWSMFIFYMISCERSKFEQSSNALCNNVYRKLYLYDFGMKHPKLAKISLKIGLQ